MGENKSGAETIGSKVVGIFASFGFLLATILLVNLIAALR